jgi:hypothetical protein
MLPGLPGRQLRLSRLNLLFVILKKLCYRDFEFHDLYLVTLKFYFWFSSNQIWFRSNFFMSPQKSLLPP